MKKGQDYEDRVPGLVDIWAKAGGDDVILGTTESGQYADANDLSRERGVGWLNVLRGDPGDLTNAIHWHRPEYEMLWQRKFTTAGSHHNWATEVGFRDTASGLIFAVIVTHLEYRATSTSQSPSEWDNWRKRQTAALIENPREDQNIPARERFYGVDRIPIIYLGDFNADDDARHDTPGEVMNANGYVDALAIAKKKSGPDTTLNGMDPDRVTGRIVDRIFVPEGTDVNWHLIVPGYPDTDHNMAVAEVVLHF